MIEEKKSDNEILKKFTMPNVQEGCIIEYTYTLASDFNYIPDWSFQQEIPIAWSEYRVSIPEYYLFRLQFQGYENLTINEQTTGNVDYRITSHSQQIDDGGTASVVSRSEAASQTVSMHTTNYRWVFQNAPAIRPETYITTIEDCLDKVSFDLASVRLPSSPPKNYSVTWEDLSKDLIKNDKFGSQLTHFNFLKEAIENIKKQKQDTLGSIVLAYDFVRKNVKWNSNDGVYAETKIKTAFENKIGNDADINLMLVSLLRELGYNANPVILSTRSHGRMLESYLLLNKFNYTIAQVNVGGKDLLLDATDPFVKPGMLPMRCLNGVGRLIAENGDSRWIQLTPFEKISKTVLLNVTLDEKGQLAGNWDVYHNGYDGLVERQKLDKRGEDGYVTDFKKSLSGWEVSKIEIVNAEDLSQSLALKAEVKTESVAQMGGNRIYFKPLITESLERNPFLLPERKYPVDFGSPIEETFKATYLLPKGYVVEEMPKSMKMTLPEDGGIYNFLTSVTADGKLLISSKLTIKKAIFYAEEYDGLKQFYEKIIAKHAEQIVLKKQ